MKKTRLILASATLFGVFALSTIAFANGENKDKDTKSKQTISCPYTKTECARKGNCTNIAGCENKGKCNNSKKCESKKSYKKKK